MSVLIPLAIYFILLFLLSGSKIKTNWIICISFNVGYCIAYFSNEIINFLKQF